ncbi:hypothetical protein HaLaN_01883 [Haematococcus lacustris]|uniref:Uncharacterized protein n=1 Tax=Haematococcus lacustris TaxID=44745 RepID=A0A699YJS1_HAELA|nr:hypothetical protein HaLaN_01883 [Haematococcus lacustris]
MKTTALSRPFLGLSAVCLPGEMVLVWGGGGLSATSLQPLSDPTAAADAHAHVEHPKRRGRWERLSETPAEHCSSAYSFALRKGAVASPSIATAERDLAVVLTIC